jgi:DNA-binding IclR family transcriptional regulator
VFRKPDRNSLLTFPGRSVLWNVYIHFTEQWRKPIVVVKSTYDGAANRRIIGAMNIEPHEIDVPAVKTIDRAARMLWVLARGDSEGLPLGVIVQLSGFGKGTTHRLLAALVEAGFAFQDPVTRRYRLGSGLTLLARIAQQQDVGAAATPYLERIARETLDTVYVSVREGPTAICVGRQIGSFPIRTLSLNVGDRRPLGVGSGSLALLAFLPDDQVEASLRHNEIWFREFEGYDVAYVRKTIVKSRRNGFAYVEGRIVAGMNALGVPVYDRTGNVVAALSLAAISDRVSSDRVASLVKILKKEAVRLGNALSVVTGKLELVTAEAG